MNRGTLVALHIGRMSGVGALDPAYVSVGKLDSVAMDLDVARMGQGMLGADGISLESRHSTHDKFRIGGQVRTCQRDS